ncbi:hypothetical protein BBJ28_00011851 [Nothophytophthora sp. Chile5]|nr:hypothetical protein BBJ28_00011851 [Nothophytophthora sp. Chile5]
MFAAGRDAGSARGDAGASERHGVSAHGAQVDEDWLSVGKSFVGSDQGAKANGKHSDRAAVSETALQVFKHGRSKHEHEKKHGKKRRREDATAVVTSRKRRHLSKHKTKKKRRHRSSSSSGSSEDGKSDEEKQHQRRRSRRRHNQSRSSSRSRSHGHAGETRLVKQSAKGVEIYGQVSADTEEKLFAFDRVGDRENQLFGSVYTHDQPLYTLATRRNLLTGEWLSKQRPKYSDSMKPSTLEAREKASQDRYFGLKARRMETDARQKRLYVAYSEKRLARAETSAEERSIACEKRGQQDGNRMVASRTEMAFIPLDPIVTIAQLVGDGGEGGSDRVGLTELTDSQNVEQHLVARGKLFNATLTANPRDIRTWLDFIAFQEQTTRLQAKTKKLSAAMKASVVEKQAAILERALASNPRSRELQRVKLNMSLQVQTSSGNADVDSVQRQLEQLLCEDPSNSELWLRLLRCRQQNFGSFSMQSVRNLYARILAVLRAESGKSMEETAATAKASPIQTPLVQVFASNSLLGSTSEKGIETKRLPARVLELTTLLLDFHLLMCTFERKAGHIERSIVQLQALIEFSLNVASEGPAGKATVTHLESLQKFAARWNQEDAAAFGDERQDKGGLDNGDLAGGAPLPSLAAFREFIQTTGGAPLTQLNPPEALRTAEHKRSLVSASATYRRKSKMEGGGDDSQSVREDKILGSSAPDSAASDNDSEAESTGGKLVYSNLHGYRINLDDADDTGEYERILNELRGTESAVERQERSLQKDGRKQAALETTLSKLEDQRANYSDIHEEDRFTRWLMGEEAQEQLQWMPLRSANPLHQELIEEQPDRAILTEEIQPFLFPVPMGLRWRLIAGLLHVCGVEWCGGYAWEGSQGICDSMYADDGADCGVLVAPIIAALDPQSNKKQKNALFLSPYDRKCLLEKALLDDIAVKTGELRDPSKVAFIRHVFTQALDNSRHLSDDNDPDELRSALKCLWIGFEAETARHSDDKEASLEYVRHLCQQLANKNSDHEADKNSGIVDLDVMQAYAKLELKLGNARQVRRICEKTLASLGVPLSANSSTSRAIHRLVFLRARLEMWPSPSSQEAKPAAVRAQERLRKLRCLFVLWDVWNPQRHADKDMETLETITKKHRKHPNRMADYLEKLLLSDAATGEQLIDAYRAELGRAIQRCTEAHGQEVAGLESARTCWVGHCLHNLALVVYTCRGFEAACQEYWGALGNPDHRSCQYMKWIWICFLEFMQQHQASGVFPVIAPRAWRSTVGKAVAEFPHDALLLRLFVDAETGNTMSQVLRGYFLQVEKRWQRHYDSPELVEWLFALLCEFCRVERSTATNQSAETVLMTNAYSIRPTCCLFHHWGMNSTAIARIRKVFEDMVSHIRTKGNALCWRLYLRFEVAMGKVDAAKKVFYRGIAACAWSKALYLDGVRVLRAYLSDGECQELFEFMAAKELHVRVDFED